MSITETVTITGKDTWAALDNPEGVQGTLHHTLGDLAGTIYLTRNAVCVLIEHDLRWVSFAFSEVGGVTIPA